jgi:hypothetical protein
MSVSNLNRLSAFVGVMALTACGAGSQQTSGVGASSSAFGQSSHTATTNVPGQPRNTDSGNVPTAPINIPAIFQMSGNPIDTVRRKVEGDIRNACGNGELCVNVTVSQGNSDSLTQCQYDSSNPQSQEGQVFRLQRGSTLTLLTGTAPCASTTEETTDVSTTASSPTTTTAPQTSSHAQPTP